MQKVLSTDFWKEIQGTAKRAKQRKAAVAYVTQNLLGLGPGDVLVVNASKAAISCGETDAKLLFAMLQKGVQLYHCEDLHAKVMLLDNVAVVGSGNMSRSSANNLVEAGVMTDGGVVVAGVASLIEQLVEQSKPLTREQLSALSKIKVIRRGGAPRSPHKRTTIQKLGNRAWLVGIQELINETPELGRMLDQAAKELDQTRDDLNWIRWVSKSTFAKECREGDSVIQIWRSATAKRPSAALRATPVLLKQVTARSTMFYLQPGDGRLAEMPWGKFVRLLRKLGYPKKVGPRIAHQLDPEMADSIARSWTQAFKA